MQRFVFALAGLALVGGCTAAGPAGSQPAGHNAAAPPTTAQRSLTEQPSTAQPSTGPTGHPRQPPTSRSTSAGLAAPHGPTKVLAIVEENHSYPQMRDQMPYLWSLAQRYGYAANWTAITHPSLPNYLAIAGGSTFGVTDDNDPVDHPIDAMTVFDQAVAAGRTARVWAEGMPANCYLTGASTYAVRHNPWTYFTASRARCNADDVPAGSFEATARTNRLPAAGMLVPDLCDDAHDCPLATADDWLKARLPTVLASKDFSSGRLAVVVTADEDDYSSGNRVLTVVLHESLHGDVVTTALTHYSLTRFYAEVLGAAPLLNGASAPDLATAFGLTLP